MPVTITIELPNEKWADAFWGWYLDGGGDENFTETLVMCGLSKPGENYSTWQRDKWTIQHSNQPL